MPLVLEGFDGLQLKLKRVSSSIPVRLRAEIRSIANDIVKYAKKFHPYNDITGNLSRSIRKFRVGEFTYVIMAGGEIERSVKSGTTGEKTKVKGYVDYAAAVEHGSSHSRARPYLFPAYYLYKPEIKSRLQSAIADVLTIGGKTYKVGEEIDEGGSDEQGA